jgi:NADPH:quinone reductase-like Zn-dependent oxidoreductase
MKAIRCREWGAPGGLRLEEAESPSLEPHQVRIRVRAAGVKRPGRTRQHNQIGGKRQAASR